MPSLRTNSAYSTNLSIRSSGFSSGLPKLRPATPTAPTKSAMDERIMVTIKVPPNTMISEGTLTNIPAEPPITIAITIVPMAPTRPINVAISIRSSSVFCNLVVSLVHTQAHYDCQGRTRFLRIGLILYRQIIGKMYSKLTLERNTKNKGENRTYTQAIKFITRYLIMQVCTFLLNLNFAFTRNLSPKKHLIK